MGGGRADETLKTSVALLKVAHPSKRSVALGLVSTNESTISMLPETHQNQHQYLHLHQQSERQRDAPPITSSEPAPKNNSAPSLRSTEPRAKERERGREGGGKKVVLLELCREIIPSGGGTKM